MSKLGITELVLRDAHQSLLATRMRVEDMLPVADRLDRVGYWSIESWGGATFDACIRYLGEDPWERIRKLKAAMPNTPQQMLLRGQNLLGYRHYADDVVRKFVERAVANGIDVFRVFDAMNDMRNLETAISAVMEQGKHAQGTMAYTVSPVHTIDVWLDLARRIEDMGAHTVCIKDMAGLLKPYVAFDLISRMKETLEIPVHLHSHATTGMSTATYLKAVEAGVDNVDAAISSMSMTYGHSASESLVSILEGTGRDTGLDIQLMEDIAAYFRQVRRRYAAFEGSLRGVDSRILVAQVPGGMLTNLESQLREQNAADKLDEVLAEIPEVRQDLGFVPLVTPTSQIVGTQAAINVLRGERYASLTHETTNLLKGQYGATPAPLSPELLERLPESETRITCRPADLLPPEVETLSTELERVARQKSFDLAPDRIDDVLTYALFPQVAMKFFENRNNPEEFEAVPREEPAAAPTTSEEAATYEVRVNGKAFTVEVSASGEVTTPPIRRPRVNGAAVPAAMAGNIFKIVVPLGAHVEQGETVLVLEAMKMETEVVAPKAGTVTALHVAEGDAVTVGEALFDLA